MIVSMGSPPKKLEWQKEELPIRKLCWWRNTWLIIGRKRVFFFVIFNPWKINFAQIWNKRYFWQCQTRVGFGPATGPTLKTALCHTSPVVGRKINTWLNLCRSRPSRLLPPYGGLGLLSGAWNAPNKTIIQDYTSCDQNYGCFSNQQYQKFCLSLKEM